MTFQNSADALNSLRAAARAATNRQLKLARLAGISIPARTPRLVAAARLRVALREELELHPRIEEDPPRVLISGKRKRRNLMHGEPVTAEEIWAQRAHEYLTTRISAHEKLKLYTGDLVVLDDQKSAEVSSIGADGRVYFKGGQGFGAWPDRIKQVISRNDSSAKARKLRTETENGASRRLKPRMWSQARASEVARWLVTRPLQDIQVLEFERVVDQAKDERPIQKFIEENPEILGTLVGGSERYCIPQKRLGDRFIPDFLIGSADSAGIRWTLVELETPRSGIYQTGGSEFDKYARKGDAQIVAWRKWIADNLSHARNRRADGGLGLFDIEPHASAFVIVGRRDRFPAEVSEGARMEARSRNDTHIHTYDWLVDKLRGTLAYSGLPAMSPYLLSPETTTGRPTQVA